ncbi:hypothetical protein GCM10007160_16220 [Litchfieldella qijiaojingensis]|uniref:Uncharacterized protein n=1 Tax=Litchfieldella qijiaojingensis TaxID=980347 RepID=A0ABQ2YMU2_9GAMM|nr:hypothetical protein GCM10007160_16220 [Halomonas qijiaojingensis]
MGYGGTTDSIMGYGGTIDSIMGYGGTIDSIMGYGGTIDSIMSGYGSTVSALGTLAHGCGMTFVACSHEGQAASGHASVTLLVARSSSMSRGSGPQHGDNCYPFKNTTYP